MEFHQTWSDGQVRLTINILDFGRDQPNAKGQRPGGATAIERWTPCSYMDFQNGP